MTNHSHTVARMRPDSSASPPARKPVRVLQILDSAGRAGGEGVVKTVIRFMDPAAYTFTVTCLEEGPLIAELNDQGIRVTCLPVERLMDPPAITRLARFIRTEAPAIVQSHGARANFYTRIASLFARPRPVIISTVHNSLFDYPIPALRRLIYLGLDRVTAPLATVTLCIARDLSRQLVERYGYRPDQVVAIQNGIDTHRFDALKFDRDLLRRNWNVEDSYVILMPGRMTDQKGHLYLLRALPIILPRIPRLRVWLAGDGPLRLELEREVERLAPGGVVHFLGSRRDLPDLLTAADLVVLPSLSEGLPLTLLEALSMGKPVVATPVNGVPEVVQSGVHALLVPPRDSGRLASAILDCTQEPDRAMQRAVSGRDLVRRQFCAERMVHELHVLYDRLLDTRSRH